MRILIVIRSLVVGGAERQSIELARAMTARDHTVLFCTMADSGPFSANVGEFGIKHLGLGHRGPQDLFRTGVRLRRVVGEFRPDVIYSFMSVSNLLCALFLAPAVRRRLVWGVRASWMDLPQYGWFPRMVLRAERWFASRPRLVIANSESGAKYQVSMGFPDGSMRVVENSIDSEKFVWDLARRVAFRTTHAVADAKKIVVIVARVDPIKGYETFIEAAAQVAAEEKDRVEFWCVGYGDPLLLETIRTRAIALGIGERLKWMGEIRETERIVDILCASDVAVSASHGEGFPNAVAEAMACGLRVVGTDVGDTCRIIGRSGKCVAAGDARGMSEAILLELNHEQERSVVRADYLSRFNPQSLLERHEMLLAEVANAGERSS